MQKREITNIYYFTTAKYPSSFANRAQAMKMAEALGHYTKVTFFVSRFSSQAEEIFKKYTIEKNAFSVNVVPEFHIRPRGLWSVRAFAAHTRKAPIGTVFYIREIMPAFYLLFLSKRFRNNFFFESHSLHRFSRYIYKAVFSFARGIIVTNSYKKEQLLKWGILEEKIIVEPNALDEKRFSRLTTREKARTALGLPLDKKIILYLGIFSPDRGSDVFMKTATLAPRSLGEFYAVGGTGEQITRAKKEFDVSHLHIHELVPYEDVPLYYSAADCLVAPWSGKFEISRTQASPLKIPEFMYSERPLIISDLPMTREWADESMVFFANPDNPTDILKQITYVLSHPDEAITRASKAKVKARTHTWGRRADRIVAFMGGII